MSKRAKTSTAQKTGPQDKMEGEPPREHARIKRCADCGKKGKALPKVLPRECKNCEAQCCSECALNRHQCKKCEHVLCHQCVQDPDLHEDLCMTCAQTWAQCDECDKFFLLGKEIDVCSVCSMSYCYTCKATGLCVKCKKQFCEECAPVLVETCDVCHRDDHCEACCDGDPNGSDNDEE